MTQPPDVVRHVPPEPVLVDVEHGGTWWPGTLTEWARWDDRSWRAYCRWAVAPGSTYLRWVPEARVRPRRG